jgi:hypothetical protein
VVVEVGVAGVVATSPLVLAAPHCLGDSPISNTANFTVEWFALVPMVVVSGPAARVAMVFTPDLLVPGPSILTVRQACVTIIGPAISFRGVVDSTWFFHGVDCLTPFVLMGTAPPLLGMRPPHLKIEKVSIAIIARFVERLGLVMSKWHGFLVVPVSTGAI